MSCLVSKHKQVPANVLSLWKGIVKQQFKSVVWLSVSTASFLVLFPHSELFLY